MPKPREQAIIAAALDGTSTTQSIVNKAINSINWRMTNFFHYGLTEYQLGLPTDKTVNLIIRSEFVETELDRFEGEGNYTIESITSVPPSDRYFITKYLYRYRDYNRYLDTVIPPNDFASEIENSHDNFVVESKSQLTAATESLLDGIPVNRYVETTYLVDGVSATLCETFEVEHSFNYSDSFSEKTTHKYDGYSRDSDVGLPVEYTLNYVTSSYSRYRGVGTLTYQEKVTRFTRFADGSEGPVSTELFDPITLTYDTGLIGNTEVFRQNEKFLPDEIPDVMYYIVEYFIFSPEGKKIPKYLFTIDDYDLDPGIEQGEPILQITKVHPETDYYPIVPLRQRNKSVLENEFLADSVRDILNKLDLDADHLVNAIESNEDIADIDEAMLITAVSVDTTENAGIKYLIQYFEENLQLIVTEEATGFSTIPDTIVKHFIRIEEGSIDMRIDFAQIERKTVTGSIGKVGTVSNSIDVTGSNDIWYLREQRTTNEYIELKITDPVHKNYIYADGVITTTLRDIIDDEENENFIIPLKRSTTLKLNTYELQELFYECTVLVCYAYEKRKLKWYEGKAFKIFMVAASIAILISTGIEIYSVFAAATTVTAGLIAVAKLVLGKYLISLGLEYAVEMVGVELSFIIAIASLALSISKGAGNNILANMNASELLQLSTGISASISSNVQKDMLEFQAEVTAFQDEAESLMDELEAKQELLKPSNLIDPFYFVNSGPIHDFNEEPSNFYRRTTQTNIADLSYAAIENFAEVNLSLPKPKFN
ncbi:hypothetical protein [Alteromonas alvinellae]